MTDLEKKLFELAVAFHGSYDDKTVDALVEAAEAVRMERMPPDAKAKVLAAMVENLRARELLASVREPYRGVWDTELLWKEATRLRAEEDAKKGKP